MEISLKDWMKFKDKLTSISEKAAEEMVSWIRKNGGYASIPRDEVIQYAYALATKYGEASASLSAQMYDEIAELSRVTVPSAVVAETASYGDIAKAVNGVMKNPTTDEYIGSVVGRYVKRAGADTTLQNALRDGAEFAWVPQGDTCAFCIALASRGWQKMSKDALKNGHAEHIHANCDCQYAVRFDGKSSVESYDPEKYRKMYDAGEGSPQDKINAMRRANYAANKDEIKAQKRAAYALRTERQRSEGLVNTVVDMEKVNSQSYRMQMHGITGNAKVDDAICEHARTILEHRSGTNLEDLVLIDADTGKRIHLHDRSTMDGGVKYDDLIDQAIKDAHDKGQRIIAIHNHPGGLPPTVDDGVSALNHGYDVGVVVGHNGAIYTYTPSSVELTVEECNDIHNDIAFQIKTGADRDSVWYTILKEYGIDIHRR